jgi:hypothetical protein
MIRMAIGLTAGISIASAQNTEVNSVASDPNHLPGVLPTFFARDSALGSPYLAKGWLRGTLELSNHRRLPAAGQTLFFNYDKMNEKLFVTDGLKKPWTIPRDSLQGFWLVDSAVEYDFEKVPLISRSHLLRVLVRSDGGYSLYKRLITKFVPADYKNFVYWTTGTRSDKFVDGGQYYLVYPGNKRFRKLNLNVREIKKALPSESSRLDKFFAQYTGKVDEQAFIILMNYLNEP